MPLILPLNKSGSGRRASPKIKYKEKVIMINKEQMMEKTKLELNKMLAQVGNNISASKLKNTNKETLVQMIIDAETANVLQDSMDKFVAEQNREDSFEIDETPTVKYDENLMHQMALQDSLIAKMLETNKPEVVFNSQIIGDSVQEEIYSNLQNEPKNIDEMFDGKVVSLADVKEQKNLKNGKTPKSSSRPDYDVLYNQFKTSLSKCGVNIFAGRTNRLGEMKALTHVKGMQWAVIITKSGFRFELYMQDDEKGINELYLAMKKDGQDSTKIVGPTGKSTRHKICVTYDGHDAKEHGLLFNVFYNHLMVGIKELYPLPKSVTKTA
jgi:hypothetical protein